MTTDQVPLKSDKIEASFVVDLKRKPMQELRRFMAGPWTASILSSEEIEEIYQRLKQKEVTSSDETEDNFVAMGKD
jgi:DNA helicase IV